MRASSTHPRHAGVPEDEPEEQRELPEAVPPDEQKLHAHGWPKRHSVAQVQASDRDSQSTQFSRYRVAQSGSAL